MKDFKDLERFREHLDAEIKILELNDQGEEPDRIRRIEAREWEFYAEHVRDDDNALLENIKKAANHEGDLPEKTEILGYVLLLYRFGSWKQVKAAAGLSQKSEDGNLCCEQGVLKGAPEDIYELQKRESEFCRKHKNDSDEELLEYIRNIAVQLGKVPSKREVPGFIYIKSRFGPWPRVLEKAGLKETKQDFMQTEKNTKAAANSKNKARRRRRQLIKALANNFNK